MDKRLPHRHQTKMADWQIQSVRVPAVGGAITDVASDQFPAVIVSRVNFFVWCFQKGNIGLVPIEVLVFQPIHGIQDFIFVDQRLRP